MKTYMSIAVVIIVYFISLLLFPPQKKPPKQKVDSTDLMRKQKKVSNEMDKQLILWDSLLIEKKKRDTLRYE